MDDSGSQDDTIRTDHFGDWQGRGDLNDGDAGFFEFGGDRSAAARARTSRGREDDCVDAVSFDLFRNLPAEAARVR